MSVGGMEGKMKTKIISVALAIFLLIGLSGCGGGDSGNDTSSGVSTPNTTASDNNTNQSTAESKEQPDSKYSKKSLIDTTEDDSSLYVYDEIDGGISITKYIGSAAVAIVPSKIDGKSVVQIGYRAFGFVQNIEAILLPSDIQTIKAEAFTGCPKLQVVFTNGSEIKEIEESTFSSCNELLYVEIPNSVEKINGFAFQNSTNVTILTSVGSYAEDFANQYDIKVENN
jgi:hypothetical protein